MSTNVWNVNAYSEESTSALAYKVLYELGVQLDNATGKLVHGTVHTIGVYTNPDEAVTDEDNDQLSISLEGDLPSGIIHELMIVAPYLGYYTFSFLRVLTPFSRESQLRVMVREIDQNWLEVKQESVENTEEALWAHLREKVAILTPFIEQLRDASEEEKRRIGDLK